MENKITICQQFKAPNDQTGTHAQLWVGYDDQGRVIRVWDENHNGKPEELTGNMRNPGPIEIVGVHITRGEYKRMKRMAAEKNILFI